MQANSIISNNITEEILRTGHLSIRFMTDGFSLLLEDKMFRPVVLKRFSDENPLSLKTYIRECEKWLERHTLIPEFKGEVTIMVNQTASTLVPDELFDHSELYSYLQPVTPDWRNGIVKSRQIKSRNKYIVYDLPELIKSFAEKFPGNVRMLPSTLVMYSLADQVNAADHQRGFAMIEVQSGFLSILVIREDHTVLSNHLFIKKEEEVIYHTLNSLDKVNFRREKAPLYYTGDLSEETLNLLKKYVKNILPLSYHILEIEKESILEHTLLAEATRCE